MMQLKAIPWKKVPKMCPTVAKSLG
jgi:hypothetical protein